MQKKSATSKASDSTTSVLYVINVGGIPPKNVANPSNVKLNNASEPMTIIPIESSIGADSHDSSNDSANDVSTSDEGTKIIEADSNSTQLLFGEDDELSRQKQLDEKYGG